MKYLSLPIKCKVNISEGWIYTKKERLIHKNYFHNGIDYETNYKEPVYACADGYAVASYHRFPINDKLGFPILFKNQPLSNGLGLFIQIYHPEKISKVKDGTITQYGHLSKLEYPDLLKRTNKISYDLSSRILRRNNRKRKHKLSNQDIELLLEKLEKLSKKYNVLNSAYGFNFSKDINTKESYLLTPDEMILLTKKKSPYVKHVRKGELIGYTGTSAVFYGNPAYNEDNIIDINEFPNSWDEIHLHFEIAKRDWQSGAKIEQLDPYNIYKSKKWYQNNPKSIFID